MPPRIVKDKKGNKRYFGMKKVHEVFPTLPERKGE